MRRRICLFVLFLCLFPACSKKTTPQEHPVPVTSIIIKPQTTPANFEFVGVAESSHLVEIWSRVEGYLWKIAYQEGSFVKAGDLLFEIDPRQFIASVEQAKGELARQKAILWAAEQAVKRFAPLYEQKAASKKDLDDATAQMLAGEAAVEMAKANLEKAQLNLSYTAITSPIDGLTGRSKYREGTLITPNINGLLTTVAIVDPIWVLFSVSDSYLLNAQSEFEDKRLVPPANDEFAVSLTFADGTEFPYFGKVNFASPTLDQATGTMTVRAVFPNPEKIIRPGQFVRATAHGATYPNAIIVPQQAIQQGADGMYVYVIVEGKAQIRLVQVGNWYENAWIIKSGLKEGDEVIVEGVNKVMTGSTVHVIKS